MSKSKKILLKKYIIQYASTSNRNHIYKMSLKSLAKKIESFESYLGKKLYSNSFDNKIFEEFIIFLKNDDKNYKNSTIRNIGQKLSEFLRKANKDGYAVNFRFEECKLPEKQIYSVYLSEEEIQKIYNLKELSNSQEKIKDLFCLNCYLGLRFTDLINLSDFNLSKNKLEVRTKKTDKKVLIPIHPIVKEIIKKYNGIPKYIYSLFNYNKTLKLICKKAKINEKILIERNEGNKFIKKNVPKWQLVTAHTARRSFATNAYLSGIKPARIMKLTGHTSEQTFFQYIRISDKENVEYLLEHPFFNKN